MQSIATGEVLPHQQLLPAVVPTPEGKAAGKGLICSQRTETTDPHRASSSTTTGSVSIRHRGEATCLPVVSIKASGMGPNGVEAFATPKTVPSSDIGVHKPAFDCPARKLGHVATMAENPAPLRVCRG